jgi:ParB family transcriptional regulator, chromosome partitioning protein
VSPQPAAVEVPRPQKAAILRGAAGWIDEHPKNNPGLMLPTLAHHHELTVDDIKTIVHAHGWPRPASMRRAADALSRNVDPEREKPTQADGDGYELVHVDDLTPDPNNVRDDLGDLTELTATIRDVGILQPIVARRAGTQLVIVMGHRRHAAGKAAGLSYVPVVVRDHLDADDVLAAMIIENGQRRDLDPIEEARALARFKADHQLSDAGVADRIAKSQPYVSGRLALLGLTPDQQAAVRAGTLPLARATKLGRDQGGTTKPGAAGKKSAAHLDSRHPLAEKAAALCEHNGHHKNTPGRPGGVACGHCWEAVIRADERDLINAQKVTA